MYSTAHMKLNLAKRARFEREASANSRIALAIEGQEKAFESRDVAFQKKTIY